MARIGFGGSALVLICVEQAPAIQIADERFAAALAIRAIADPVVPYPTAIDPMATRSANDRTQHLPGSKGNQNSSRPGIVFYMVCLP